MQLAKQHFTLIFHKRWAPISLCCTAGIFSWVRLKSQGSTSQQRHPSSAYHYRRTESKIALMVTIQSTNQRSKWGKDHSVNFGTWDVLALRPVFFKQPNPVLFFRSGYWTQLTKTLFQLILSLDSNQDLPLRCLYSQRFTWPLHESKAHLPEVQSFSRQMGRKSFTRVNTKPQQKICWLTVFRNSAYFISILRQCYQCLHVWKRGERKTERERAIHSKTLRYCHIHVETVTSAHSHWVESTGGLPCCAPGYSRGFI